MYFPWLWVICADNFQHTMGMMLFCLPPLGPGMCTHHPPMHDGPDTWLPWWCDCNCRWCHHPLQGWWWPWQTPPQIGRSGSWTQPCVQWVESVLSNNHLWPYLDVCMTRMGHTLTLLRLVKCTTCLPQRHQYSSRSSSIWPHMYHHFCHHFHPYAIQGFVEWFTWY